MPRLYEQDASGKFYWDGTRWKPFLGGSENSSWNWEGFGKTLSDLLDTGVEAFLRWDWQQKQPAIQTSADTQKTLMYAAGGLLLLVILFKK